MVYAQYRGRPPLHAPILATLHRQIADADADLRRDIDADWKACVLRYPEVLAYFYSLVNVRLPPEASPPQLKGLSVVAPDAGAPPRPLDFAPAVRPDEQLPARSGGDVSGVGGGAGSAHAARAASATGRPGVARAASTTKKSAAGGAKRSAAAAARAEREKELDRDLAADLYPRGAERRRSVGGAPAAGLAGLGVPPPPGSDAGGRERERRARRRDSGGYYTLSGRNGVPPGAPMPPGFW